MYNSEIKVFNKKNLCPTIGVIKNNRVSYREMLQNKGLKYGAQKTDVNLIIYSGGMINCQDELESTAIYDFVDTNKLDGLIIWTGNINWFSSPHETNRFVKKYDCLPLISLETKIDDVTSIVWDDFNAMANAIIHLIDVHKCRKIAFIRGLGSHYGVNQRYKAYIHVLEKYGIPINEKIIIDDLYYNDEGIINLTSMWSSDIDAIVAYNDMNARFVTMLMEREKLPFIPIIGFDDEIEEGLDKPYLTTVHPPLFELGNRGMELIIEKIKGVKVPQLEVLPCRLIVRQSCGCSGGEVIKEHEYREKACIKKVCEDINNISADDINNVIRDIIHIPEHLDIHWASELTAVFLEDVRGDGKWNFVNYLESLIQTFNERDYMEIIQSIIMILCYFSDSFANNNNKVNYLKSQNILMQATNLISEIRIRFEINKKLQEDHKYFCVISFSNIISNALDINDFVKRIKIGLKIAGISSCYVSLYENQGVIKDKSRLIIAYDEEKCIEINHDNSIFSSIQLLPEGILSGHKRFELILKPLHSHKRQIGFVLFGDSFKDLWVYEQLSESISIAINSVMSIEDIENKTQELRKTNYELEFAYQSLKENQQKLLISEKMASIGRLAAGIAHEMNTPLAAVRTSLKELLELVDEYGKSIENPQVLHEDHESIVSDMYKYVKLAQQSARKSVGFIRGIKAQATDINDLDLQLFNAAKVITDDLSILEFALKRGNCKIFTSLDNSIKLYGDPNRFAQIVTNLVTNSIDACKPGGGNILINLVNNGEGSAKLTVQDNGCGIPDEILSKIFDPMFTTKPFGEGTGIGLSIVHDLVGEFKGSIKVDSKKGMTAFIISLPIIQEV